MLTFKLPEAGLLLILAIDQFLDMGRTATNVVGNSIATAVIARTTQMEESKQEIEVEEIPQAVVTYQQKA